MLRIFAQSPNAPAPETHLLTFTSSTAARAEADAIKNALSTAIQRAKAAPAGGQSAAIEDGTAGYQSAAMAIASAVSSTTNAAGEAPTWYGDSQLSSDIKLQQSLLKADPQLQKTFVESLRTKPEIISNSQFTAQFWSSRLQLLRAHAIDKNQSRGAYNVLSTIKPKTIDSEIRLKISPEQIQLIFNQHPLVKRVYDENVPKLNERDFWSRFFTSRLFKKLKGEKITDADAPDPILDKYLHYDENVGFAARLDATHVPHIIDLEGNEVNNSQRKGNQPDWTMRPTAADKVPIIRTLNSLSEKIMAHVAPADIDPSEPIGMDEETFNELALRDLQGDAKENRILLNIRDQRQIFSKDKENDVPAGDKTYDHQDPRKVLADLRTDIQATETEATSGAGLDLQSAIGFDPDEDSDYEEDRRSTLGKKSSIKKASAQIFRTIQQRRANSDDAALVTDDLGQSQAATSGISPALFDRLQLTHATTTEFLHHFWLVFLSGDADKADELSSMVESLNRAMDRIEAVAIDADEERKKAIDQKKRELREAFQRDGRKRRYDYDSMEGGSVVVHQMLGPTIRAVSAATAEYRKALALETVDAI
jgi:transcription initiation factor TFIIH subunit 1